MISTLNEEASAGFIVWVAVAVILIATYWIASGIVIDYCGDTLNTQIDDSAYYTSQLRVDTFNTVTLAFRAIPIIGILSISILAGITMKRKKSGVIG